MENPIQPRPPRLRLTVATFLLLAAALIFYFLPLRGILLWHGHERLFPVVRVLAMLDQARAGESALAPWMPDICHGYGWPFFTFYAPLGYLAAVLISPLTDHAAGAVAASFVVSVVLSAAVMYGLALLLAEGAPRHRRPWWALAAALAWSMAPYHSFDVFARAGLASAWSWPALAGVLFGFELSRRNPGAGLLAASFSFCALFLSHNISALYGGMFLFAYAVLALPPKLAARGWLAGIIGFAMAAWFWIPALALLDSVRARSADAMWGTPQALLGHTPPLRDLLIEIYRPGGGLGIGPVILSGAGFAGLSLLRPGGSPAERHRLVCITALFLVALLMMTRLMPWGVMPGVFRYIQFPWRLMIFTALFGSMAIPAAAGLRDRGSVPAFLPFVFCAAAFASGLLGSRIIPLRFDTPPTDRTVREWYAESERKEGFYAGCYAGDYLPVGADERFLDPGFHAAHPPPANRLSVMRGRPDFVSASRSGSCHMYEYSAAEASEVMLHVFDFPGWRAELDDGAELEIGTTDEGLVALRLPAGVHSLVISYQRPGVAVAGACVSAAAWSLWGAYLLFIVFRARRASPSAA